MGFWHIRLNDVYAKKIDATKTRKLLDATTSEYYYRLKRQLPVETLVYDDWEIHFDPTDLNEVIMFIENDLIPTLESDEIDLMEQYGGWDNFITLFKNDRDFLSSAMSICEDENYFDYPPIIARYLGDFRDLIKYALSVNRLYEVYVD
ncbi:hypothetical protein [Mucilaginibacter celer]|uniref:Uncharacterized protein n=1 Tax=Mucilaginibacter celer TaxID=2305508 RepID=A0A494VS04_9SPHI|nr:hypothetical protein [Mucilaginibacter celer]AYL97714.1 hypothetical protein HYN43_021520 [Mucilaginibacter celer]